MQQQDPAQDHVLNTSLLALQQRNEQLQHQVQVLHLLHQLALQLTELSTPSACFELTAELLALELGFEQCFIVAVDEESRQLQLVAQAGEQLRSDDPLTRFSPFLHDIVTEHRPIWVHEIGQDLGDALLMPVQEYGRLHAVLCCAHHSRGTYQESHQQILQHVATMLGHSLGKIQDMEQLASTVNKLAYAEQLQKALYNIASLSFDETDPREFYHQIHQNVATLVYAENFFIALYDELHEILNFPYFADQTDHKDPSEFYPKEVLNNSLTGYVFRTKQPLLIHRHELAEFHRSYQTQAFGSQPECWLGVPFDSGDGVRGVVVIQSYDHARRYGESERELLTFVSQHISAALGRAFAHQRLRHQALHDALTFLPNRTLLLDRLEHALVRYRRYPTQTVAVMYLDLDRFKLVNDTLGHQVGDDFLVAVAQALRTCLRQNDTLARLGGDEFAILLQDVVTLADVEEVANRIHEKLEPPVRVGIHQLQTSASIGIAMSSSSEVDTLTADEIIRRADIAMYQAKQDGRGISRVFCEEMDLAATRFYQLELEIKQALQQGQFELHYQPVVELHTDTTLGFEALIRWKHPNRGWIAPSDFVNAVEDLGLAPEVDRYVVAEAISQIQRWRQDHAIPFYISVNISAHSICRNDFALEVLHQLYQAELPAEYLAIELTESALIDNIEQARGTIDQLRDAGILVFLDDFGTGYSSLSYLHQFKLDVLKIDRSFIANMQLHAQDNPVVNAIIALARTLQLKVVAEGIESSMQRQLLHQLGCQAGQGFWFAKPLPARDAVQWLR